MEEDYANMVDESDELEDKMLRRGRGYRRFHKILLTTLLLLCVVFLLRWIFLLSIFVPDTLMYPAIDQESRLMVLKTSTVQPGDVALIEVEQGHLIRRVIAGPGSTVEQTREGLLVDGEALPRTEVDTHNYIERHLEGIAGGEHICEQWVETIAGHQVPVCLSRGSERPRDAEEVGEDEYYVRCDNRALCNLRRVPEGRIGADRIRGRVLFLMGTADDSEQPFYKRWFGLFESVP